MVTLVDSSATATQALFESRKKAEILPVSAGLAHKTWVHDLPPFVVLQIALSLNTQSFVPNTAEAFCAQPTSRSIMWMESNWSAWNDCFGCGWSAMGLLRAALANANKPPKTSARQRMSLGFMG